MSKYETADAAVDVFCDALKADNLDKCLEVLKDVAGTPLASAVHNEALHCTIYAPYREISRALTEHMLVWENSEVDLSYGEVMDAVLIDGKDEIGALLVEDGRVSLNRHMPVELYRHNQHRGNYLVVAANKRMVETVRALLASPDYDIAQGALTSACHAALNNGDKGMMQTLMDSPRVDPSEKGHYALRLCAIMGDEDMMRIVLSHPKSSLEDALAEVNKLIEDLPEDHVDENLIDQFTSAQINMESMLREDKGDLGVETQE